MKDLFQDWGKTFLYSALAVPASLLGLHEIERGLTAMNVTPDVLTMDHFFNVGVLTLESVAGLGSGLIGAVKLWKKQWGSG